jgi:anti-sigma factor RsiW
MKCKKCQDKIIFYLEGDLPARETREMEKHLAQCSSCAALAEELRKTLAVLHEEKNPEVNPFFYTRLKARMTSQTEKTFPALQPTFFVRVLQPVLFSLLLLAGIYSGMKIGQTPGDNISTAYNYPDEQMIPYLNEMETESIETFLME